MDCFKPKGEHHSTKKSFNIIETDTKRVYVRFDARHQAEGAREAYALTNPRCSNGYRKSQAVRPRTARCSKASPLCVSRRNRLTLSSCRHRMPRLKGKIRVERLRSETTVEAKKRHNTYHVLHSVSGMIDGGQSTF